MKVLEIVSKTGKAIRFEAEYVIQMADRVVDADGHRVILGQEPTTVGSKLTVYADGIKVGSCEFPSFWGLIDLRSQPGHKKIRGLNIVFTDPAQAEEYERWIASVKEAGTPPEVSAYKAAEAEARKAEEIAALHQIIRAAERQADIPPEEVAAARRKAYNDAMNEGGEGFVPRIISLEEYDGAVKRLAELTGN